MNKRDFLSAKQRQCEFRKWKPKEKRQSIEKQQTVEDFIAKGGVVVDCGKIKRDRLALAKKVGVTMPRLYE